MMSRLHVFLMLSVAIPLVSCSTTATKSTEITNFSYPWAKQSAPRTVFQAHTAGSQLHLGFVVDDAEIIVEETWSGESTVNGEDRVEVFFARDEPLTDYWCLEIDPLGRVHDYHASHYRKFDSTWNCPGLEVQARRTDTGYEVNASVPLQTLSNLLGRPIKKGSLIRIGLFRADFFGLPGNTRGQAEANWISWVHPDTPEPDFHVPSAFRMWEIP